MDLPKRSWVAVLKRTVRGFKDDHLIDYAAALTYHGVLSIFPALLALTALLGLLGTNATQPLLDNLGGVTPGPAKEIVSGAIQNLQKSQATGGLLFVVALVAAIWSSSGYVAAFMRASNVIYEMPEGRSFIKKAPVRLGVTIALLIMAAVTAFAVVLTADLARHVGNLVGLGDTAVTVWDIAKWPALAIMATFMFSLLYWAAPNVRQPGFRWLSPGGVLAVLLWIIASAGFALYVANFNSYNKTYGTLGGVILFMIWLWLSNIAVLLGAEFDAELERGRQIEQGYSEETEPFLPPRDTTKMSPEEQREADISD